MRTREEITEELDYQPSQFVYRHYVRFVYADPKKQTAPKLPALLYKFRDYPTPDLLSAHRRGDFRVISARVATATRVR